MSTKSKRRENRRHPDHVAQEAVAKAHAGDQQVAGEIVGQLLTAITFGAVEQPESVRHAAKH